MEKLQVVYMGDLHTEATHARSGVKLITSAPVDNQGKGDSFSPTDLFCTSLASCMLTIMGIAARTHGFSIDGCRVDVAKEMAADPRRVGAIYLDVDLSALALNDKQRTIVERSAHTCPVMQSIGEGVRKEITFRYE